MTFASIEPAYADWISNGRGGTTQSLDLQAATARARYQFPTYAHIQPEYKAFFEDWRLYQQTHEGGLGYVLSNLFRHPQERDQIYVRRILRATHLNHARIIVSTYATGLYRNVWTRQVVAPDQVSDTFLTYLNNIDLNGASAHSFFKRTFEHALTLGTGGVLVSRLDSPNPPGSLRDQIDSGMRPYCRFVSPFDLVDWQLDAEGEFDWVAIREFAAPARSFGDPVAEPQEQYRLWTRTGWHLYQSRTVKGANGADEVKFEIVQEGTHPCGKVPLVLVRPGGRVGEDKQMLFGLSLLRDLAPLIRKLMNYASLIDEQVYQHVFNILVVPKSLFETLRSVDWSSAGVLPLEEPNDPQPKYLAPDTGVLTHIRDEIRETELAIRYFSGLGRVSEGSRAYVSDSAIQFHTQDKRALIEGFGASMRDLENEVHRLAGLWLGLEESPVAPVQYTLDIETAELQKLLSDGLRVQALGIDPRTEANYEIVSLALKRHLSGEVSPDRLKEILEDFRQKWIEFQTSPPDPNSPTDGQGFFNTFEGTRKVTQIPVQAV